MLQHVSVYVETIFRELKSVLGLRFLTLCASVGNKKGSSKQMFLSFYLSP